MQYDDYLKGYDYTYLPPIKENFSPENPVISIILDAYFNLDLVKKSIQSVLDQTYKNVELILVDNGALEDVKKYLVLIYENNQNVSLIKFTKNVFSWDDVCVNVAVCWNAALKYSKGEYISHLAYDDLLSTNYCEKMVRLFLENPNCFTAAPIAVSIDINGNINGTTLENNQRGRFTKGFELALDSLEGNRRKLFSAPGEIFVIKKELLIKNGGYDRIVDISQLYKYAIEGDSGFDPEAKVFWRHHSTQTNKLAKGNGNIFYKGTLRGWEESDLINIWYKKFGSEYGDKIKELRDNQLYKNVLSVLHENVSNFHLINTFKILLTIRNDCPQFFKNSFLLALKEILYYPISIFLIIKNRIKN